MSVNMQLKEAVGQLLLVGYEGTAPTIPLEGAVKLGKVSGVIFFTRNFTDLEQIAKNNEMLSALAPEHAPIFLAIDQEGGKVQRIRENLGATNLPPGLSARGKSKEEIYRLAQINATELKALGFNLNFTPVLDIHSNPANPVIAERAYGLTPEEVIENALPVIQAHADSGMLSCGKHFPGHGDTDTDSHFEMPVLDHDLDALRERELRPFKAAIDAKVPMIMTSHIRLPKLDELWPATLSENIMTDLLRHELGFEGVVVSDDMEMNAIANNYSILRACILGIMAGVDLFIISRNQELWLPLRDQLVAAATNDKVLHDKIYEAAERVLHCKKTFLHKPTMPADNWRDVVGCAEHKEWIKKHFASYETPCD